MVNVITDLTTSIKHFTSLNRAPAHLGPTPPGARPPHKPLLLLALLDRCRNRARPITPAIINNTSSVTYLRRHALGARLDDGLFRVMQSGDGECAGSSKMLS